MSKQTNRCSLVRLILEIVQLPMPRIEMLSKFPPEELGIVRILCATHMNSTDLIDQTRINSHIWSVGHHEINSKQTKLLLQNTLDAYISVTHTHILT